MANPNQLLMLLPVLLLLIGHFGSRRLSSESLTPEGWSCDCDCDGLHTQVRNAWILAGTTGFVLMMALILAAVLHYHLLDLFKTAPSAINPQVTQIPFDYIKNVTDRFNQANLCGSGAFGAVYKGTLEDGTIVAVKRMVKHPREMRQQQQLNASAWFGLVSNQFKAELSLLSQLQHKHLLSLVGYCMEGVERILVYPYMPNGSLLDILGLGEREVRERVGPLDWRRRLTLALDIARGVEYLHKFSSSRGYIHRGLKPQNILIGADMRARIADFGTARGAPTDYTTQDGEIMGTRGYMPPEHTSSLPTTKSDVFSFGVILWQLITGKKALDLDRPDGEVHLRNWCKNRRAVEILDPKAGPTNDEDVSQMLYVVHGMARCCCHDDPDCRPDMSQIVAMLSTYLEPWIPHDDAGDDIYPSMTLRQLVEAWVEEDAGNTTSWFSALSTPFRNYFPTKEP